jgi:hypothetical protein
VSEQPPTEYAPPGWFPDPTGLQDQRWWDGRQWGHQTRPQPETGQASPPLFPPQAYGQQPPQPSFTSDPQHGASPGQPPYRDQRQPGPPSGDRGRPARRSWPQRHKALTVLGSLTALIIVIGGIASISGKAKEADNASAVTITTPTRTAAPSPPSTHHATSTETVPTVTAQATTLAPVATAPPPAVTTPPPAVTTRVPVATTRAPVAAAAQLPTATTRTAPPPPAATSPAGCRPLSDENTCYEPGEYCRDADHGESGIAGDGKTITCEDNDGWRWEPS